mgnify:CR=1 FL=1
MFMFLELLSQEIVGSDFSSLLNMLLAFSQREACWDREDGSWLSCPSQAWRFYGYLLVACLTPLESSEHASVCLASLGLLLSGICGVVQWPVWGCGGVLLVVVLVCLTLRCFLLCYAVLFRVFFVCY